MGSGKHSANSSEDYSFDSKFERRLEFDDEYEIEEERKRKKIIIIVAVIIVLAIIGFAVYKIYFSKPKEPEVQETPVIQEEPKMAENIDGYKVLGKIVIENLNIEQYILDSSEDKALEKGVCKIYGASLNSYGNFCIAGHNYDDVFIKLPELKVGDEFTIVDKKMDETKYKITEIYSAEPDDLKCLIQNDEKVEITLITCENGATTRLIVKAEEIVSETSSFNTNTINMNNTSTSTENTNS